jgi:adenylate kinase
VHVRAACRIDDSTGRVLRIAFTCLSPVPPSVPHMSPLLFVSAPSGILLSGHRASARTPLAGQRQAFLGFALATSDPSYSRPVQIPSRYPSRMPHRLQARAGPSPSAPSGKPSAPLQIIISGAPASGKGTQCELIVARYGIVHISTGDMLRAAVKAQSPLGVEAKRYMDDGNLVPDELVIAMLQERIARRDCVERGWLLDGFPRTAAQADALNAAGVSPAAVIALDVSDDVLVDRVIGRRLDPETGAIYHVVFNPPPNPEVAARLTQRSDDTEDKARTRLDTFHANAKSIEDHYSTVLCRVDGNRGKQAVFSDITGIIDAVQSNGTDGSDSDDEARSTGQKSGDVAGKLADEVSTRMDAETSTRGMPVAEFVRKAEEAYERGYLSTSDVNWSGQAGADSAESDGTASYADLGRRLDVVLGDATAILLFAWIGRASHGNAGLDGSVFQTALPFLATWFLIAPLLGAYTRSATATLQCTFKKFAAPWAVAVPAGIALRGKI